MAMRVAKCVVVLAACLGLVLASGCSDQTAESTRTLVFSFGSLTDRHEEVIRKVLDDFEKANPGLKVVVHGLAPVTDLQRHFYQQSFTARSAFIDVFEMDTIWTAELAAAGVLLPPGEMTADQRQRMEPQALAGATYGGQLVAVPAFPAVSLLFFRTDLLEKHSAVVPGTFEELTETAARIAQAEGIAGFVWQGDSYEGMACVFLEVYRACGGRVKLLPKGVGIDRRAATTALEMMRGWIDAGVSPEEVTRFRELDSRRAFLSGKAVFARGWDDLARFVDGEDSRVKGKVGVAMLPGTSTHAPVPTLGGWHLAVNGRTMYPQEALKLVSFLTSPESQAYFARELGRLPVDAKVALPPREIKGLEHVREALALARTRPHSPYYHDLSIIMQEEIHDGLTSVRPVKDVVDSLLERAGEISLPREAGPDFPRSLLNPSTVF